MRDVYCTVMSCCTVQVFLSMYSKRVPCGMIYDTVLLYYSLLRAVPSKLVRTLYILNPISLFSNSKHFECGLQIYLLYGTVGVLSTVLRVRFEQYLLLYCTLSLISAHAQLPFSSVGTVNCEK